jgi:hypothetical protein
MGFKLVSKNNIGVLTTLIFVVLLSQVSFFDFLIETPLGRIILLTFVIFIAYTNHLLGLVAVLCVVIAFNNNTNIVSSYEGFDTKKNKEQNKLKQLSSNAKKKIKEITKSTKKLSSPDSPTTETETEIETSREGFCMTDRESNMLRGKQSGTISVFNTLREQSDDVSPSEKYTFTSEYATF